MSRGTAYAMHTPQCPVARQSKYHLTHLVCVCVCVLCDVHVRVFVLHHWQAENACTGHGATHMREEPEAIHAHSNTAHPQSGPIDRTIRNGKVRYVSDRERVSSYLCLVRVCV